MVAPGTGAWVETDAAHGPIRHQRVAPGTGAWVETRVQGERAVLARRRPRYGGVGRNCGAAERAACRLAVAPGTGAWVETSVSIRDGDAAMVAPGTGAWVETTN